MRKTKKVKAIVFADIGGSSSFYKKFGDTEAKQVVDELIDSIKKFIIAHNGIVIKTIGDEVMCAFEDVNEATNSSISMQTRLDTALKNKRLYLNIGIGFGEVIQDNNDLFGTTVNETAHLTKLASNGQILISQSVFKNLNNRNATLAREFDQVTLKGGEGLTTIFRIYWQDDSSHGSETQLMSAEINERLVANKLNVRFQGSEYRVNAQDTPFVIGRDKLQSDMFICGSEISRSHCHIEFSRGKFVIVDHSTNGTYLLESGKKEIYLRRESHVLAEAVAISLGIPIERAQDNLIELAIQ